MNFIEKIIERLNLIMRFDFLNRSNSPSTTQKIDSSNTGPIAGRDNYILEIGDKPSNLEKMVIKILYKNYENSGSNHLKIEKVHKELEIKAGQYVGTLNNSKYVKLDGDEYYIKDEGIRYMDNLSPADAIILPVEKREKELERKEEERTIKAQFNRNSENNWKNSAK